MKTAKGYRDNANRLYAESLAMGSGYMSTKERASFEILASIAASMIEANEPLPTDGYNHFPWPVYYRSGWRLVGDERKGERRLKDIGNHLDDGSFMFNRRSSIGRRKIDNRNDPLPTMAHAEAKIAALYRVIDNKDCRIGFLEMQAKAVDERSGVERRVDYRSVEWQMGDRRRGKRRRLTGTRQDRKPGAATQEYEATRPTGEWTTDTPQRDPMTRRHRRMFTSDTEAQERIAERDKTIEELRQRVESLIKALGNRNDARDAYVHEQDSKIARLESEAVASSERAGAQNARIIELDAELKISDNLIADRNRILDALPCPMHGACVPYVLQWIEAQRERGYLGDPQLIIALASDHKS